MAWALRGLREGVVTTRYPRRPDGYGDGFRATVSLSPGGREPGAGRAVDPGLCPTGAISAPPEGAVRLDRGRCILCGRCVAAHPELFRFDPDFEVARCHRSLLVVPEEEGGGDGEGPALDSLRRDLAKRVRSLRRSVNLRHVDAGSDGSEEWEIAALTNPVYDVQRLGIFFTASPRHADVLLVTGVGTIGMAGPLATTYEAMADPKVVVAVGTDAVSGGLVHPTYATAGGLSASLPVDVLVPGSPPSPFSILHGLLLAMGRLAEPEPPVAPGGGRSASP